VRKNIKIVQDAMIFPLRNLLCPHTMV